MGDMSSLGAMWVDAAASLLPRLQASALTTDTDGACPTEAMDWLHEAGLCSAPLPQPNGGPGLNDGAERLALLRVLKHIGRGNLVVGLLYEGHVNALQLVCAYEQAKYAATMAALPNRQFERAFEIGCSIGVLTALLAPRCSEPWAIDVSDSALHTARQRLAALPRVHLQNMTVPSEFPDGSFDLVVLSEVGCYWSAADLHRASQRIVASLRDGATLVMVH